ncbi:helix-turn-helix domain-containing protein [Kitasatospora cineracea]
MGPRLRAARARDGRSLGEVCRATGLAPSTLSRMENGRRKPTLEALLLLAREYRVPLDELAGTAPARSAPPRRTDPGTAKTVLPLTHYVGGLHAHKHVLPAATAPPPRPRPVSHPGHEWLCVLSGRLRLALGDRELLLTAGEATEFDTRTPHAVANAAPDRPVEYLVLFGPQGERLRTRPTGPG